MRMNGIEIAYHAGASSILERQAEDQAQFHRRSEFEKPLPKFDDPLVRVKVLVAFRAGSPIRETSVGEIVEIARSLAHSLAAIQRCEILA
jgi:hypothetical protein